MPWIWTDELFDAIAARGAGHPERWPGSPIGIAVPEGEDPVRHAACTLGIELPVDEGPETASIPGPGVRHL
ncbi:MAG: hypothetical protein ACE5GC_03180 [Acidimicrobiia bacterium]